MTRELNESINFPETLQESFFLSYSFVKKKRKKKQKEESRVGHRFRTRRASSLSWFTWNPNKYQEFSADLIKALSGKYPYKWRENACRIGYTCLIGPKLMAV